MITHVAGRTIHTFDVSWSGVTFTPPAGLDSVELLVIGGGGGGGSTRGGDDGAGDVVHEPIYALTQASYLIPGRLRRPYCDERRRRLVVRTDVAIGVGEGRPRRRRTAEAAGAPITRARVERELPGKVIPAAAVATPTALSRCSPAVVAAVRARLGQSGRPTQAALEAPVSPS